MVSAESPSSSISQKVIAGGMILGFLYLAGSLVMTVVVSILLASTLDPAVAFLSRKGVPRGIAAMTMVMALLGGTYLAFYLFYAQAVNFAADIPKAGATLRVHMLQFREKADQIQRQTEAVISPRNVEGPEMPTQDRATQSVSELIGVGWRSLSEVLVLMSFIPFLVYFFLTWKSHLRRSAVSIVSGENRVVAERTLDGITRMIHGFVVGNVIIGVMLSVVSALFFWTIHLPYVVFLGPMSGFLSLVPYFGVVLALLPPLLVGLAQSNSTGSQLIVLTAGIVSLHLIALNVTLSEDRRQSRTPESGDGNALYHVLGMALGRDGFDPGRTDHCGDEGDLRQRGLAPSLWTFSRRLK